MAGRQDQLEIKFRLTDGSDIGPKSFPAATSVATLKESILAQWPKDKENGPRTVKDVKLISAGKILENNRTVGECQSPICDIAGGVTTMHVVVQQPTIEKDTEESSTLATNLTPLENPSLDFLDNIDDSILLVLKLQNAIKSPEQYTSESTPLIKFPLSQRDSKKKAAGEVKQNKCGCVIL